MDHNGLTTILILITLIILLLFTILIFPGGIIGEAWAARSASLSGARLSEAAQEGEIEPPGTLEEAKERGGEIVKEAQEKIPGIMKKIWEEEARPVWQKMWDWAKNWWENTVWPWISDIFQKRVKPPLEKEIEKRKPIIEEELEKEKAEIKKEAPEVGKSLWQRFKELFE